MGFIQKIFSGGATEVINAVGNQLDKFITTKPELEAAKLETAKEVNRAFEALQDKALEQEKAYLLDVQNARALQQAALSQGDTFSKRFLYYLAAFIILSATAFGFLLFVYPIPEGNKRMVEMFADVYLFAGALSVIYFFFGSSKSSHDKSDVINRTQSGVRG